MKLALLVVAALALVCSSLAMSLDEFMGQAGNEIRKDAKLTGRILNPTGLSKHRGGVKIGSMDWHNKKYFNMLEDMNEEVVAHDPHLKRFRG